MHMYMNVPMHKKVQVFIVLLHIQILVQKLTNRRNYASFRFEFLSGILHAPEHSNLTFHADSCREAAYLWLPNE